LKVFIIKAKFAALKQNGNTMNKLDGLTFLNRGKVRDLYDLGDSLLIVTSDRISVFDVILPDPIENKGVMLTKLSTFWFDKLSDVIENHLITADINKMPEVVQKHRNVLEGRVMQVKKAKPFPVECIVRGYLTGSGYKDYVNTGSVCGIELPKGLVNSSKLPEIIFTPSTKAEIGEHDENINFDQMVELIGNEHATALKKLSIEIFKKGMEIAEEKGIIIADTKFEFGLHNDKIILIDEVLTPDSSRFWPKDSYEEGKNQDSFDKQYVRDYYDKLGWDKKSPASNIPEDVQKMTAQKYEHLLKKFIG
jgi:phosphoribosylaminoimidazole-succinocarboxamide synthase